MEEGNRQVKSPFMQREVRFLLNLGRNGEQTLVFKRAGALNCLHTMAHSYDLEEFQQRFTALRERGFVRSRRNGPTGVGHTLEQELGMPENNLAVPDLGKADLKGKRIGSSSLITLFSFNRKAWQVKPLYAIQTYGSPDKNGRTRVKEKGGSHEIRY